MREMNNAKASLKMLRTHLLLQNRIHFGCHLVPYLTTKKCYIIKSNDYHNQVF